MLGFCADSAIRSQACRSQQEHRKKIVVRRSLTETVDGMKLTGSDRWAVGLVPFFLLALQEASEDPGSSGAYSRRPAEDRS